VIDTIGNTMTEQLAQSNSGNSYMSQTDTLSRFR